MENWVDIKGYEGLYQVSDLGLIKSLRKNTVMKPFDNKGYERIALYKNGKREKFLVHVLVVEHFVSEKPFHDAQVNHKDGDRKNNKLSNLEWCTPSENVRHCIEINPDRLEELKKQMREIIKEHGKLGIEASKKPVVQLALDSGEIIATFESARQAAKETGANYKTISNVCRGKAKTHLGYLWKFI